MKLKALLAVAMLALAPGLHAFTLDFASTALGSIPSGLTVYVPDYGDVSFTAGYNSLLNATSNLEIGTDFFGARSLQFENGDTVIVTFLGDLPGNVEFEQVAITTTTGTGTDENFAILRPQSHQFVITLQNSDNGAGIGAINFPTSQVPEPSTTLLGVLGVTGLAIRRRR